MFRSAVVVGMMASACLAGPQATLQVRPLADVIEIRLGMLPDNDDRARVRGGAEARGTVVGELSEGRSVWHVPTSQRERLGGADAPELIYVRVFDAVFAIDPFVALPQPSQLVSFNSPIDETVVNMLFRGSSLETDPALLDRTRVDRVEELFRALERARQSWLRSAGYYNARTVRHPSAEAPKQEAQAEPAGWFRKPAGMPRTKSREQVRGDDARIEALGRAIASGEVRMSLPPTVSAQTRERIAGLRTEGDEQVARQD